MRIRNPPRNSSKFPTLGRIRCAWRLFPEALAFGLALMVLPAWKCYILPMLHEAHEGHEDYATWKKMFRWNRWNPGWWFGTVFIFHFMYGIFIPTDWYFSRLLKPPTRTPFLILGHPSWDPGRCRCEGHRPPVFSESPRQARWKKWRRRRLVPDRAYSADWDPAWPWSVMRLLASNFLVELFLIHQNWGIGHMLWFFEWSPLIKSKDRQEQIEPEMFINLQPRRFSKSAHCLKDMPIGSDAPQSSSPAGRTVHFRLQIKCGVRNFAHVVHPASRLTQFGSTLSSKGSYGVTRSNGSPESWRSWGMPPWPAQPQQSRAHLRTCFPLS